MMAHGGGGGGGSWGSLMPEGMEVNDLVSQPLFVHRIH